MTLFLTINETLKWLLLLSILMNNHSGGDNVSIALGIITSEHMKDLKEHLFIMTQTLFICINKYINIIIYE